MSFLTFIVTTISSLYISALLLRVWMQWARVDYYSPFAQMIVRVTQPILKPLRKVIPALGPIDTASVFAAFIISAVKLYFIFSVVNNIPVLSNNPGYFLLMSAVAVVKASGSLLFWVLIIRALMSWVSQGRSVIDYLLMQLTEPLMAPIRRIIPPFGGLDFSVMAILFILTGLNYLGYDSFPFWAII